MTTFDPALLQALVPRSGALSPDDPDYAGWVESREVEDWIADGCPPVEGFEEASEHDRAILLARPLTVAQAARREAVSERTIYRWLTTGELEAHRAGRGWRIAPDALDARRVQASKPRPRPSAPPKRRPGRRRKAATANAGWWPS